MQAIRDLLVGAGADYDAFIEAHGNDAFQCLIYGDTQALADAIVFFEPTITQPVADAVVAGEQAITEVSVVPTSADFDQIIWAEENGTLSANNLQWSFGNGSIGVCNVVLPNDGEIVGMTFAAETFGTSVQMELMINDVPVQTPNFTANNSIITFSQAVSAGDRLGFRTDLIVGTTTDVRVAAIYRQGVSISGIQGPQGIQGPAGNDGIAAVSIGHATVPGTQNINSVAGPQIVTLNTLDGNSGAGWSLAGNEITYTGTPQNVKLYFNFRFTSTGQRVAPEFLIYKNGVDMGYAPCETGYIRQQNTHDSASANATYADLNPGTNPSYSVFVRRGSTLTTATTCTDGGLFAEAFT